MEQVEEDDFSGERASTQKEVPSEEQILTDQRYVDVETGIVWYVGADGVPYKLEN